MSIQQPATTAHKAAESPRLNDVMATGQVWQGRHWEPGAQAQVATGHSELDQLLGGGWLRGALTEIRYRQAGMGEMRLLVPALAELSQQNRWLMLLAPPMLPNASALEAAGVDTGKLLVVRPDSIRDRLWTLEESLRSGTCSAVIAWPGSLTLAQTRRLQLAAEAGQSLGILLRQMDTDKATSNAATRLALSPGARGPRVEVLKRRGALGQNTEEQLELDFSHLSEPYCPPRSVNRAAVIAGPWAGSDMEFH